jgi:antitoxin component of MazEF toxin-antitoxin module
MTTTLTRHGNSFALVIAKPILEQMGVDETTPLTLVCDGRCMIIARASSNVRRKMVSSAIAIKLSESLFTKHPGTKSQTDRQSIYE